MATLIGVVSQVVGEVFAVAGDGTRRPLVEGDRVYAGEQLVTGASGAVGVTLTNGELLTLGRDSSMGLNEQMLASSDAANTAVAPDQAPPAPSDSDLTDVEQLQAAIEAGVDPTLEGEATAAGPGAAGAGGAGGAGGVGGGHSFVLLGEVGGALDPTIGFPTEGLNTGPEFPDPEPIVTAEVDFFPTVEIIYFDEEGRVVTGPGVVEESELDGAAPGNVDHQPGSNAGVGPESISGSLLITSPDGISAIQVLDTFGVWINVQGGGTVQGKYGVIEFDAAGNWTYTLTDNTLDHSIPGAVGADDQLLDPFSVRVIDGDGDVSPAVPLNIAIYDDGPAILDFEIDRHFKVIADESVGLHGSLQNELWGKQVPFDEIFQTPNPDGMTAIGFSKVPGAWLFNLSVDAGADGEASRHFNLSLGGEGDSEGGGVYSGLSATDGGAISLYMDGSDVVGRDADDDIVFRVHIDEGTGNVTLWQYEAIDHGFDWNNHDSIKTITQGALNVSVTIIDGDGDPAASDVLDLGKVIGFEDDGPQITCFTLEECARIIVDESVWITGSTQSEPGFAFAADEFGHWWGPDGTVIGYAKVDGDDLFKLTVDGGSDKEDTSRRTFEFSFSNAVYSGLYATEGGAIKLYADGDDVVGKDATGDIVFRLHIDEDDGDVTLWQYEAIKHGADGNDHDALKTLTDGVLKVKVTVYDNDGDYDKAYVDVGKAIGFEDDGPKITCFELGYRAHVVVDESVGTGGSTQSELGLARPNDESGHTWDSTLHKPVIGYAQVDGDDLFKLTVDAGSDKEDVSKRSFEFSFSQGVLSGLSATNGGLIRLYGDSDDVVGKDASGGIVFRLHMDENSGDVTLWQYEAINHGWDGNDHDALKELADGVLKVKVTVYDKDGDYDKAYVDLGKVIGFEDDGPKITCFELGYRAHVVVDESVGTGGSTQSELGLVRPNDESGHTWDSTLHKPVIGYAQVCGDDLFKLTVDGGSDKEDVSKRSFEFSFSQGAFSGLSATDGGIIKLYGDGDDVVGKDASGDIVFRLHMDENSGDVTLWQYEAINHGWDGNDHDALKELADGVLKVKVTVYDKDGDYDKAYVDLGKVIGFEDDGPKITCFELGYRAHVIADESKGVLGSLQDEPGNTLPFDEVFHSPGPDGAVIGYARVDGDDLFKLTVDAGSDKEDTSKRTFEFSVSNGAFSGLYATDGGAITLFKSGDDVVGKDANGDIVFRLRIDEDDGDVTLWQYEAINHGPDGNDHDALKELADGVLKVKVTVYDKDGDYDKAYVDLGKVIGFEDDGPAAGLSFAFVDEDGNAAYGTPALPDRLVGGPNDSNFNVADTGRLAIDAGSDGLKSVAFAEGTAHTLFGQVVESGGHEVMLDWQAAPGDAGGVLEGYYMNGDVRVSVFTLELAANNLDYTFALHQPLDHNVPGTEDELYLKLDFTVTDGDGDTANGVVKVVVDDDTPVLNDNVIESCLTVTYEGGDAGFSNSYGYYIKAPDGTPTVGAIIWANVHDIAVGTSATVSGLNPEDVGFFIIPNGASFNGGVAAYADGAALTFVEGVDGWQAYLGGVPLTGDGGANALFDNPLLNPTDDSHVQDNAAPGNENWEDVHVGGDNDFNDVNIQVQWKNLVHEDKLSVLDTPIAAPYEGNEELSQSLVATGGEGTLLSLVNFGADGPGTVSLIDGDVNAVMSGANPGLTSGGEPLFYSVSGGVLTAYAGEGGDPVFSLSVTEGGGYTFTLLGPLDHDATPATDNDLDTLVANAGIDFTRVLHITDYDGDPVDFSNASGRFVIRVEDDAPIATCDAACFTEQAATINILMAFDFSNSMFFDAEGGGNRFEAIYGAVDDMFAAYDAQGDVNIRIVGFSNGAAEGNGLWTSAWFSSATAAAQWLLDTFNDPGRSQPGGTNYEAALDAARAAWADGTPTEGSNVAYFITDGYSNGGNTYGATGDWTNFLTDEGFIGNYVVAVGGSGNVDSDGTLFDQAELDAIAAGAGGEVILADFGSIAEDLAGTAVLNQLEGNLVTGDAHGGVADLSGADGWLKDGDGNDVPLVSVKFDRNGDGDFDDADESYDIAESGPTIINLGGDLGSIEFYANGQYVYKAGDLPAGEQTLNFQYTVMDNDRTSSTACFELNLKGIQNTLPHVGEAIARVSEEGLSTPAAPYEGIQDTAGHLSGDDTTNMTSVINGTIDISDADGDALTVSLVAPAPGVFMSGGVAVVWTGDGTNHLVGTKGVGGVPILEVTVSADGHYSVELKGPVDHPYKGEGTAGEDALNHVFIVQVSDGTGMSEGKITVQIEDDSPVANAITKSGQAAVGTDTNLLIVLDVSGSMGDPANVGGMSRLEVAKSALLELFEQYDALGDVKVSLVTFATGATTNQVWVNLSDAKAAVLALNDGGNTNYDAALINAINAYGQTGSSGGKLTGSDVQNVAYFLSDGYPNEPGSDAGISNSNGTATDWPTAYNDLPGNSNQASEEQTWINFLNTNDIRAYSLGMGTGVDANALNPIAYDGSTGTNTNAIVVSNLNNLTATLVATAQASPINGNLKENGGGFGADGGFVRSLTVGGNTYTYNGAGAMVGATPGATFNSMTHVLTIVLAASAGTLAVNMDSAAFTFTPPDSIGSGGIDQSIGFVLQDFDGDYSGNTLSLHIDPAQSVTVVRDDLVLTNQTTINLPDWALLHNDTGPNSATQSITGVGSSSGFSSLSHGVGSTLIVDNATAGGSFAYTNSVSPTDEGHVDVVRSTGSVINGTFRDEILIGGAGADTLNGGDGNDILIGGGTAASLAVIASVKADGPDSPSNSDFLHFAFASGGAGDYIQSISINLRAGSDNNATFDANGGGDGSDNVDWGPTLSNLIGLSSGNISFSGTSSGTMTLTFAAGTFGQGDSFDLNIDVDSLGSTSDAIEFANHGVTATITLQDGRTQTLVFNATDGTDGDLLPNDAAVANFNLSPLSDLLNGGNGDDLLIGSTGVDIMTGGAGKDIFAWQPGGLGGGADHITDFHVDTSGVTSDALDLSQLLTGLSATPSGAELSNYLTFTFGGGSTTINVDANGSAGGVQTDQTIILDGVNLSSGSYYGSTDAGTIISGLLDDHALKVA